MSTNVDSYVLRLEEENLILRGRFESLAAGAERYRTASRAYVTALEAKVTALQARVAELEGGKP